ncbi:MAG: glycosyltransferase [Saccharothrix sp.]|nr:glycosyltransferase [Saccharothrix sp.]
MKAHLPSAAAAAPAVEHGVSPVHIPTRDDGASPELARAAAALADRLGPARIWHVNSTATGGGVAELLWSGIARQQALGLRVDWLIADAEPAFFQLTKRIHHGLHGRVDHPFTEHDARLYEASTTRSAAQLAEFVRPGDLVVLHDPQTVGLAPHLVALGVRVAWRCHIGTRSDVPAVAATWAFLRRYVEAVPHCVFTVADYAPAYLAPARVSVITPSIDPESPKNRLLTQAECVELLAGIGLLRSPDALATGAPDVGDDPVGYVVQDEPLVEGVPVVTQVSRWDPLKDLVGVLRAFAEGIAPRSAAHLLFAGPDPADIPDDPEGAGVFAQLRAFRESLPVEIRRRVHLAVLTLRRQTANALAVNAIQRYSTVVVQKSLEEGFGLTVTEAMWKSRPIVASAVGGLLTQVTHGVHGLLVEPDDLTGFADAVTGLLTHPARAAELGAAAHRRCRDEFLSERETADYLALYGAMSDH